MHLTVGHVDFMECIKKTIGTRESTLISNVEKGMKANQQIQSKLALLKEILKQYK